MQNPDVETRGGEEPGDWTVAASAAAHAAAVAAQIAVTEPYTQGGDD